MAKENTGWINILKRFSRKENSLVISRTAGLSARTRVLLPTKKDRIGQTSAFSVMESSVGAQIKGVMRKHANMLNTSKQETGFINGRPY